MAFNGIKGLTLAVAQLKGYASEEEMEKGEARREKMRALGEKGRRAKRAKEDPVMLAIKARAAGCVTAKEVAGWIERYVESGSEAANSGPKPMPPKQVR